MGRLAVKIAPESQKLKLTPPSVIQTAANAPSRKRPASREYETIDPAWPHSNAVSLECCQTSLALAIQMGALPSSLPPL